MIDPASSPSTAALADVQARIAAAARETGRDPARVHLIAVSKTFEAKAIVPVLDAGQRLFGENRVQEAKAKWPDLRARYPDTELHLIGPLQSNKTREAVELFDAIHTVDRPKIARAIAEEQARQGKRLKLFIEVNTGEEPQKSGVVPGELDDLVALCRNELGLDLAGLMAIPPEDEDIALHAAFLAKLARENGLPLVSIGMSGDYETAIRFGATHVRVGTAIFGARAPARP